MLTFHPFSSISEESTLALDEISVDPRWSRIDPDPMVDKQELDHYQALFGLSLREELRKTLYFLSEDRKEYIVESTAAIWEPVFKEALGRKFILLLFDCNLMINLTSVISNMNTTIFTKSEFSKLLGIKERYFKKNIFDCDFVPEFMKHDNICLAKTDIDQEDLQEGNLEEISSMLSNLVVNAFNSNVGNEFMQEKIESYRIMRVFSFFGKSSLLLTSRPSRRQSNGTLCWD